MTKFFLGADIGGTNTRVLIADEKGRAIGFGDAGPGNPEGIGYAELSRVFQLALGKALHQAGCAPSELCGLGFGVAGFDWPSQTRATLEALVYPDMKAPARLVNDTILGLMAGAEAGWGVAVVSGTGCNCWGWDPTRRKIGHVTGGGSWMGEGAGAAELMAKTLQAVAQSWTLRGPQTCLGGMLAEYAGARDVEDLLEGLMSDKYHLEASAAPLVFQAAEDGDEVAQNLIEWAGTELGELANAVTRQLSFQSLEFEVVLLGSMFSGGERLVEPMRRKVQSFAPGARLVRLHHPPVVGAVLLGMEAGGWAITPRIRETLFEFKVGSKNSSTP